MGGKQVFVAGREKNLTKSSKVVLSCMLLHVQAGICGSGPLTRALFLSARITGGSLIHAD